MSIMPEPYAPPICRENPNSSTSQVSHKSQKYMNLAKEDKNCLASKKQAAHKIVQNIYFQVFITIFTISSLLMEDLRVIFIDICSDSIIDGVNIMFISIFMFQIVLSFSIPGYVCSFFFYLDILSTISIIMDLSMFTNYLYSANALNTGLQLSFIVKSSKASRAAARAVRVIKIFRLARIAKLYKSATKANELKSKKLKDEINQKLQKMKLQKLKKIEKDLQNYPSFNNISKGGSKAQLSQSNNLFLNSLNKKSGEKQQKKCPTKYNKQKIQQKQNLDKIIDKQQLSINQKEEILDIEETNNHEKLTKMSKTQSKISKLLSQNSMKKIIIIILLLMFSAPILDVDNFYQNTSSWDFLSNFIVNTLNKPQIPIQKINQLAKKMILNSFNSTETEQLILFKTPFQQLYYYDTGKLNMQRINDLSISQSEINITQIMKIRKQLTLNQNLFGNYVTIILSNKSYNKIDSWFSILKIVCICIGIIYLLNSFNQNITQLITQPIQKMLEDVKNNGLSDEYFNSNQNETKNTQLKNKISNNYQTTNLHLALTKIQKMIQKIFGTKGKANIYKKIFQEKSIVQNYLSQNKKVYRIFGICSIDNYYAISQILKQNILILNKEVSQFLHSAVYRYGGNCLVNHEGYFIVSFQCPSQYEYLFEQNCSQVKNREDRKVFRKDNKKLNNIRKMISGVKLFAKQQINNEKNGQNNYLNILSDFSIFSLVKTLVKISKQAKFYKYRKDSRLVKLLGDNFQIKLNCTLHSGWVEEGFIGSSLKMDYFCFGQTIQTLNKISYFCHKIPNSIIVTQSLYKLLSQGMKRYTRIMDQYVNKQDQIHQQLYLVDLNLQNISPPKSILQKKMNKEMSSVSLKRLLNMQYLKDESQIKIYRATSFINSKKQLRQALKNVISEQFRRKYTLAFQLYVEGDFNQSKQILDEIYPFNKEDHLVNRLNILIEKSQNIRHLRYKQHTNQEEQFITL